jgi:hypothetical protein
MKSIAAECASAAIRAAPTPRAFSRWRNRSSSALERCAVVRPDSPLPICSFSSTTTRLPARASAYATLSPAMPAPMTQTSVVTWSRIGSRFGTLKVSCQIE